MSRKEVENARTSLSSSTVISLAKLSPYSSTAPSIRDSDSALVKNICLLWVSRSSIYVDPISCLGSNGNSKGCLPWSASFCRMLSKSQDGLTISTLRRLHKEATWTVPYMPLAPLSSQRSRETYFGRLYRLCRVLNQSGRSCHH